MVIARVILPAFVFTCAAVAAAAQTPAPRTISVNGSAEIKVAPDEVILSVGVETDSKDIAVARSENDARVKAITQAARAQAVTAEHVKTDFLDIQLVGTTLRFVDGAERCAGERRLRRERR